MRYAYKYRLGVGSRIRDAIRMSLEENFRDACERVKKFPKRPPDDDLLEIYSLYKQATIGDVNISRPSDVKGKAKWEAWNGKKGMTSPNAKEKYVDLAKRLAFKYE